MSEHSLLGTATLISTKDLDKKKENHRWCDVNLLMHVKARVCVKCGTLDDKYKVIVEGGGA